MVSPPVGSDRLLLARHPRSAWSWMRFCRYGIIKCRVRGSSARTGGDRHVLWLRVNVCGRVVCGGRAFRPSWLWWWESDEFMIIRLVGPERSFGGRLDIVGGGGGFAFWRHVREARGSGWTRSATRRPTNGHWCDASCHTMSQRVCTSSTTASLSCLVNFDTHRIHITILAQAYIHGFHWVRTYVAVRRPLYLRIIRFAVWYGGQMPPRLA